MKHSLIVFFFFFQFICQAQKQQPTVYVCPPCQNGCDALEFNEGGKCSVCGMNLMRKTDLIETEEFYFTYDNVRYSAEIGKPKHGRSVATIVLIPGHGRTDFVAGRQYYGLKQFFTGLGLSTLVWDKQGCGNSGGTYAHHQSVESSAREAIAAIEAFKQQKSHTSKHIGLWGISRAGWICPLIINQYPSISFWISVSGTDQFDTFRYMVESNLKIEGRKREEIDTLMKEFDHYISVLRKGGESYEEMVRSTDKLFADPFYTSLGEKRVTEAEYKASINYYATSTEKFDEGTGVRVFVPGFDKILSGIKCPVLAVFGELDSQVNWKSTEALYKKTMGTGKDSRLEIKTLPNCNHNIMKCETGGLHENLEKYSGEMCDGYYVTMQAWLAKNGFSK